MAGRNKQMGSGPPPHPGKKKGISPKSIHTSKAQQQKQRTRLNLSFYQVLCAQWRLLFLLVCLVIMLLVILQMYYAEMEASYNYQRPRRERQVTPEIPNKPTDLNKDEGKVLPSFTPPTVTISIPDDDERNIAIGCAISTRGFEIDQKNPESIGQILPILKTFMSSFCKTASPGFHYHFYLAYDHDDPFLTLKSFTFNPLQVFHHEFFRISEFLCPKVFNYSLHMIQCDHSGHPAWAQNDAMMAAYLDNIPYFFRINDDTTLITANWTENFINGLKQYDPPNVGVVGPTHKGGNTLILTYDFVHKTHIDIFGWYYPRSFDTWWADDWITRVYEPTRAVKLENVEVIHTSHVPKRYDVDWKTSEVFKYELDAGHLVLQRYLDAINNGSFKTPPDSSKVISMSLYGAEIRYTYGAIRNAQLCPIIFPEWTLRIYVEKKQDNQATKYPGVPDKILHKLLSLGAQLQYIDAMSETVPPMMWRFLVAGNMSVKYFLIRDIDSRLTERDAIVVQDWIASGKPFHCIRDHPSHAGYPIMGGAWGGRPKELRELLPASWKDLMRGYNADYIQDMFFLGNSIWPHVQTQAYCHDSVSCRKWPGAHPFPIPHIGTAHIGQVFNAWGQYRTIDVEIVKNNPKVIECVPKNEPDLRPTSPPTNPPTVSSRGEKSSRDNRNETKVSTTPPSTTTLPPFWPRNQPYKNIVIWTMDYHVSPVWDIKDLLVPLGVKFIDKSLSSYCGLSGTCARDIDVINTANGFQATPDVVEQFYDVYQYNAEMNRVTHFICFVPAAMCELYMKFHKHIIVVTTSRYEQGRFTADRWYMWNRHLVDIADDRRNVVAANNHYDIEYMRYFTGIDPEYIPSYCGYVGVKYNPTKPEFLLSPIRGAPKFQKWFQQELNTTISQLKSDIKVVKLRQMYPTYKFSDLASHPGIIHVPYQVSMISMCEQYRMNIPLFVPSLNLLARWHFEQGVVSQRTWNSVRRLMDKGPDDGSPIPGVLTHNTYDPNSDRSEEAIRYWLRFADYYQWSNLILFDSVEHLVKLLQESDLKDITIKMDRFNAELRQEIVQKWTNLIDRTLLYN